MDVDVFCWTISREMGFVRDEFREVTVPFSTSTSPYASRTAWIDTDGAYRSASVSGLT